MKNKKLIYIMVGVFFVFSGLFASEVKARNNKKRVGLSCDGDAELHLEWTENRRKVKVKYLGGDLQQMIKRVEVKLERRHSRRNKIYKYNGFKLVIEKHDHIFKLNGEVLTSGCYNPDEPDY